LSRFLVTYLGGQPPADPTQAAKMHDAFEDWLKRSGDAVVDPGAPVMPATQVANGTPQPRLAIGGYSVIEAANIEAALEVLKSHPFVARGGTLQVDEAVAF